MPVDPQVKVELIRAALGVVECETPITDNPRVELWKASAQFLMDCYKEAAEAMPPIIIPMSEVQQQEMLSTLEKAITSQPKLHYVRWTDLGNQRSTPSCNYCNDVTLTKEYEVWEAKGVTGYRTRLCALCIKELMS